MKAKNEAFDRSDAQLAAVAKALSHPARVRILRILAACNRCITADVVDRLPLAQATVSQHLRVLREAGLVRGEIEGPATCYCLDPVVLATVRDAFARLFEPLCCAPASPIAIPNAQEVPHE